MSHQSMNVRAVEIKHHEPARTAARRPAKILLLDEAGASDIRPLAALPGHLRTGDVFVVNDAATIPASLQGMHAPTGAAIEARLVKWRAERGPAAWMAAILGDGDWHTPTEYRPLPPLLAAGDQLLFKTGLSARIQDISDASGRLVNLVFDNARTEFLSALYASGKPIQYSYHRQELALWDHQTLFAGPPVALEPPSAAMQLTWRDVFALKDRGVYVVALTHATGISSTGDKTIDALLPFPERYSIPKTTAETVSRALADGRRVFAVGTGTMRALESAVGSGGIKAGTGETNLRISSNHVRRVVSGILTGLHDQGSSHLDLLASFVRPDTLKRGYGKAETASLLWHEYGDVCLIINQSSVAFDQEGRD